MPYELDTIEENNINKILSILNVFQKKNLNSNNSPSSSNTTSNTISIPEKIVYANICCSKINENTLKKICLDLNVFLSKHILMQQEEQIHMNINIELFNAFNILYEKSINSIRSIWIINVLKESICSMKLLDNTDYVEQIMAMFTMKVTNMIIQLNGQINSLYNIATTDFDEKHYQYIIQKSLNLQHELNHLHAELLHQNNLLIKLIIRMHLNYIKVLYIHKPLEILDSLTTCDTNIFNFYNYIIDNYARNTNISNTETIKNRNYIKNQKNLINNLHFQLLNHELDKNQKTLAKDKLITFNTYYTKCEIILDINEYHFKLEKIERILLDNKQKCLSQNDYLDLLDKYEELLYKSKIATSEMYSAIFLKVKNLNKTLNNIRNIYKKRSVQYLLLTDIQEHFVYLYFKYNPDCHKISKKLETIDIVNQPKKIVDLIKKHNDILPLMYSVIRDFQQNNLFVLLHSDKTNIALRNASIKQITGLLGIGTYGKVKLAQALDDYSIVAVKIQQNANDDLHEYKCIKREEKIQKILHQFVASSEVHSKKSIKYYTLSKYIKGQTLYDYFNMNSNLTMILFINIIIKVLRKIDFLHNPMNIVHGDLNFMNILYEPQKKSLEIIDFGFSDIADQDGMIELPILNSQDKSYLAPECYHLRKATFASDIYSIAWWIKFYIKHKKFELKEKISPKPFEKLNKLLKKMLNNDYHERPKIKDCIQELELLVKNIKKNKARLIYQ